MQLDHTHFASLIIWTHLPDRGRGLIVNRDIEPGSVLDLAPALAIDDDECNERLRQYLFKCKRNDDMCRYSGTAEHALVFGPMALCNHSDKPNAAVYFEHNENRGLEARLVSHHRIHRGEEVTISYSDACWYKESGLL